MGFSRGAWRCPGEGKSDAIRASFKNGVLEVRVSRTEKEKTKSIAVKIE
jgi:HSP20 family molecular chaperone IbpA